MEELKNLCRKADQSRTMHSLLRDELVFVNILITAYVTVGSAISAMLIFAPINTVYEPWVGGFLASIFIVSLIPSIFDLKQKIVNRTVAVQLWGKWLRGAKITCCQENIDDFIVNEFIQGYKDVMDQTPLIPDKKFNKYKQKHLQKVAVSRELDKFFFKPIKEIKKDLAKQSKEQ